MRLYTGRRVLVADDEPLVAFMVADMLMEMGVSTVGPAYSLKQALVAIEAGGFEAAILDVNLGDGMSYEAARLLRDRRIPFCFATGYGVAAIPEDLAATPILGKPYQSDTLATYLGVMFSAATPEAPLAAGTDSLA